LNSDVAGFTTHESTWLLATNQVIAESTEHSFLHQNLYMLRVSPAQGKLVFAAIDVTPRYGVNSA